MVLSGYRESLIGAWTCCLGLLSLASYQQDAQFLGDPG